VNSTGIAVAFPNETAFVDMAFVDVASGEPSLLR
jgi:hypothetical protein